MSKVLILSLVCLIGCASKRGFDENLSEYHYPFKVEFFNLYSQRQQLKMAYGLLGNKESKKIAVLLHGKNFAGFYWHRVAEDLVKKGYKVVIPDQIGFGKSSKPENYDYSFAQLALNTKLLLDSLVVNNIVIVGHSMGGMLATHFTSLYPEFVSKLVLVNPIGLEDYLKFVEFKDPQFFYKAEVSKTIEGAINYQKKNYYDGKWKPAYEALLEPFKGWRESDDYELIAWNNALTYGPIFTESIVPLFREMKTPVKLILGTRDRTGPGRNWKKKGVTRKLGQYQNLGKEIKALNPKKIQLIELKGLGHMPQFENYKAFSKVFYPIF